MITVLAATLSAGAQMVDPVHWKQSLKMTGPSTGVVTLTATIDDGWHMYALQLPDGGPLPTSVEWNASPGVEFTGDLTASPAASTQHDETFDMDLSWWTGRVTLTRPFKAKGKFDIKGKVRYMACNDHTCTSPEAYDIALSGTATEEKEATPPPAQADTATTATTAPTDSVAAPDSAIVAAVGDTWAPVDTALGTSDGGRSEGAKRSLWYIFLACVGAGLIALLTPCVWPIIPMTVSFFLKKSGSRKQAITRALTYGLSIFVIYVLVGLLVTVLFGANTLNLIATSAVCNILFFILLVVFAISFFGAFDITLPSSWSGKMDRAASSTTGVLSIFLMAFTLVIVSFSCTGPIIGTLLVEAANQGDRLGPAVGMAGFALALAVPFSLFALFPSWLKKLPRSGGWLNTVKVTLGFIELALSLKFLSVADLAYGWHILDREVFLALWIAIFGLLGLYLLGMFRFASDGESTGGIGVLRFFLGLISIAFTAYLLPGLWGAPLRATSAFVPPLWTQDFNLYGEEVQWSQDYDEALTASRLQGKPVLVDFSGYGCVNCRKMEGAVLDRDDVRQQLSQFVTVRLMTDDRTPLPQPRYVVENGKQIELTTRGDLWSYLQRHKFGANSQPYYVILDSEGRLLSGPVAYDENIEHFTNFLNTGLNHAK